MTEHEHQTALIQWLSKHPDPRTGMIFAIPNAGKRSLRAGAELKKEGMRTGGPDLLLPVACGGYHGLFIELKTLTGRPTPEQKQWITALREQGYHAVVCRGCEAAKEVVDEYLSWE
jgi:hypothetical protein